MEECKGVFSRCKHPYIEVDASRCDGYRFAENAVRKCKVSLLSHESCSKIVAGCTSRICSKIDIAGLHCLCLFFLNYRDTRKPLIRNHLVCNLALCP